MLAGISTAEPMNIHTGKNKKLTKNSLTSIAVDLACQRGYLNLEMKFCVFKTLPCASSLHLTNEALSAGGLLSKGELVSAGDRVLSHRS